MYAVGGQLPDRFRQTGMVVLGLFRQGLGFQLFQKPLNSLMGLTALLVVTTQGEWSRIFVNAYSPDGQKEFPYFMDNGKFRKLCC